MNAHFPHYPKGVGVRFTRDVKTVCPDRSAQRPLIWTATLVLLASCGHAAGTAVEPRAATEASVPRVSDLDAATQFLSGIPRCPRVFAVMSTHEARDQPEGTKVTVRGMLVHNPKWDCPGKACAGKTADGRRGPAACCNACRTRWFVVDAADVARPYMSRARLYLRETGQTDLLGLGAQDCEVAKINAATPPKAVVVTGTFQGAAGEGGGSQLIEDARLCVP